eukprot:scaffold20842_cov33-Tisochrysis_lutea.AAC.4
MKVQRSGILSSTHFRLTDADLARKFQASRTFDDCGGCHMLRDTCEVHQRRRPRLVRERGQYLKIHQKRLKAKGRPPGPKNGEPTREP